MAASMMRWHVQRVGARGVDLVGRDAGEILIDPMVDAGLEGFAEVFHAPVILVTLRRAFEARIIDEFFAGVPEEEAPVRAEDVKGLQAHSCRRPCWCGPSCRRNCRAGGQ